MQADDLVADFDLDGHEIQAFLGTMRVATELATTADAELRKAGTGMKASDWDLLALLALVGPMRPSELVARSSLSGNPTTVSTIIGRLEARSYVERQPLESDPRGVVVHLTEEGRETFEAVFPTILTKVARAFTIHFTDDELKTLAGFWSRF